MAQTLASPQQLLALSGLAAVGLITAAICFALAVASGNSNGSGVAVEKALPASSTPDSASAKALKTTSWERLTDLRRQLQGAVLAPAVLTTMVATLDDIIARHPEPAVVESAGRLKAECWMRLGDKQAALEADLAHLDHAAAEDRDAAAWRLVRSARRESRHGGAFLASQQLDEFFARFTDTRADDQALLLAAQVHQELGDREAAIGFYQNHLTRHPASPMREFTSLCLASLYDGRKDLERAAAIRADWEQERIRRANAPAAQQSSAAVPAPLTPCIACGTASP